MGAAIAFAVGFYKALGANRSIESAYKFGCVEIYCKEFPKSQLQFCGKRRAIACDVLSRTPCD
jgi:hypothetical protein